MKKGLSVILVLAGGALITGCTMHENTISETNSTGTISHSNHQMMSHPDVTTEAEFLVNMIPHHEEAVTTSEYILLSTENEELKAMAANIISGQRAEIQQMSVWKESRFGNTGITDTYNPMMGDLASVTGTARDQMYIRGMIEHHQGAIMMAQQALQLELHPETMELAENIITAQEAEITQFEAMLK